MKHNWARFSPTWFDEQLVCTRCGVMKLWDHAGPYYLPKGTSLLRNLFSDDGRITEPECLTAQKE